MVLAPDFSGRLAGPRLLALWIIIFLSILLFNSTVFHMNNLSAFCCFI